MMAAGLGTQARKAAIPACSASTNDCSNRARSRRLHRVTARLLDPRLRSVPLGPVDALGPARVQREPSHSVHRPERTRTVCVSIFSTTMSW